MKWAKSYFRLHSPNVGTEQFTEINSKPLLCLVVDGTRVTSNHPVDQLLDEQYRMIMPANQVLLILIALSVLLVSIVLKYFNLI